MSKNEPLANPKALKNSVAYNTDNSPKVSKVNSPHSSGANDSDFSFELSYQDVSYEDSLGIEKE
ncbi:hypothetical protein LRN48_14750, partial [Staphylococcus aureus]|nr:hypothetical protein [Staphylococcus aureus]